MEKAQAKTEKELEELRDLLGQLEKELGELNIEYKKANGELSDLQHQAQLMEKRLNAASKLITGLTGERTRWTKDVQTLQEQRGRLFGDCILSASFLSYAGAFTTDYRTEIIYDKFLADVLERGIPTSSPYRLEGLLTSDAVVQVRKQNRVKDHVFALVDADLTPAAASFFSRHIGVGCKRLTCR